VVRLGGDPFIKVTLHKSMWTTIFKPNKKEAAPQNVPFPYNGVHESDTAKVTMVQPILRYRHLQDDVTPEETVQVDVCDNYTISLSKHSLRIPSSFMHVSYNRLPPYLQNLQTVFPANKGRTISVILTHLDTFARLAPS